MNNRTAVVTGVVGGIGAAIAARLSSDGARVVVSDLPGDALQEAADKLGLPAVGADLADRASVMALRDRIVADHGVPAIVVNAAGGVLGQVGTPLEDVERDMWHSR